MVLVLALAPDGSLQAPPRVHRSSGHPALDEEAVRMARAAAPFRAPGRALGLAVPVRFALD